MVEWGKAPWTLKAYVVIALASAVIVAVVVHSTPVPPRLFLVALAAYGIALGIVDLVLLLHPATRRFFRRQESPTPS